METNASNMLPKESYIWEKFVYLLIKQDISFSRKLVQLSQAILECGRGSSELWRYCGNPYGMKYRSEIYPLAMPVVYHSDNYCSFKDEQSAVDGYWVFLNRKVYDGWEKFSDDEHGLIKHLLNCGYAGTDKLKQDDYYRKVCRLFVEATHIINVVNWIQDDKR